MSVTYNLRSILWAIHFYLLLALKRFSLIFPPELHFKILKVYQSFHTFLKDFVQHSFAALRGLNLGSVS